METFRFSRFAGTWVAAAVALSGLLLGGVEAGAAEGKQTFDAKKCRDCHQTEGPAKAKTIQDQLATKGPELWYAGSKFKKEFLGKWLKDPKPIRPMEFNSITKKNPGDHPKLSGKDADEVTEYLMSLKSKDVEEGAVKPNKNPKNRNIFEKKQGCYGCHPVKRGEKILGGLTGPTLIGAGERLNPAWVYAYLKKPKVFKPVKRMPVYVDILSDAEMKGVAAYIGTFE